MLSAKRSIKEGCAIDLTTTFEQPKVNPAE